MENEKKDTFFMVYVEGGNPPRQKHETIYTAEAEADRLCLLEMKNTYVLKTVSVVKPIKRTELVKLEEMNKDRNYYNQYLNSLTVNGWISTVSSALKHFPSKELCDFMRKGEFINVGLFNFSSTLFKTNGDKYGTLWEEYNLLKENYIKTQIREN